MSFEFPVEITADQMRKIQQGKTATLKPENFVEQAKNIMRLAEKQANRVRKAMKQGRGVRICLGEDEDLYQMTEGGKISIKKAFKNLGKTVKNQSGIVKRGFNEEIEKPMTSKKAKEIYKKIGKHAIEQGIPLATALASMALGDPTGMSGQLVGNIAQEYASNAYDDEVMGGRVLGTLQDVFRNTWKDMQGKPRVKWDKCEPGYRHNTRGECVVGERVGNGLFKALHKAGAHKVGITKKSVIKRAKKIGKEAIDIGADVAGEAITAYTGNPVAGEMFKTGAKKLGNAALESKNGKDALKKMKKEAKNIGAELVDDYIDKNLSGSEKEIAQKALAGKYPSAKALIYDYGNSKIEEIIPPEEEGVKFTGFGVGNVVKRAKKGVRYSSNVYGSGVSEGKPNYGGGKWKDWGDNINHSVGDVKNLFGGAIAEPTMESNIIQTGPNYAYSNSSAMNNKVMLPSPQLAGPIKKGGCGCGCMGGSMYPAGFKGGSFLPA